MFPVKWVDIVRSLVGVRLAFSWSPGILRLTVWYPRLAMSVAHSSLHSLYGGRQYVGKNPRISFMAISFLIISSIRCFDVRTFMFMWLQV